MNNENAFFHFQSHLFSFLLWLFVAGDALGVLSSEGVPTILQDLHQVEVFKKLNPNAEILSLELDGESISLTATGKIINLRPFSKMRNLRKLVLSSSDISRLVNEIDQMDFIKSRHLILYYCNIGDDAITTLFPELDNLEIYEKGHLTLQHIQKCKSLRQITIHAEYLEDIGALEAIPLENVSILRSSLSSVEPLASAPLIKLHLSANPFLLSLPDKNNWRLRELKLVSMPLTRLPEMDYSKLTIANLRMTCIDQIHVFKDAPINEIYLDQTRINCIDTLEGKFIEKIRVWVDRENWQRINETLKTIDYHILEIEMDDDFLPGEINGKNQAAKIFLSYNKNLMRDMNCFNSCRR